jgi:putative endonuclease
LNPMDKYFVYAIKSTKDSRIYVGMTKRPEKRLIEHNKGYVSSTKYYIPWKLIYQKLVGNRKSARTEEKRLKSGFGKEFLKSL